jgi:hypothetical protein
MDVLGLPEFTREALTGYLIITTRQYIDLDVVKDFLPETGIDTPVFLWDEFSYEEGGMTGEVASLSEGEHQEIEYTERTDKTSIYRETFKLNPRKVMTRRPIDVAKGVIHVLARRLALREIYQRVITIVNAPDSGESPLAAWDDLDNADPMRDMMRSKNRAKLTGYIPNTIILSDEAAEYLFANPKAQTRLDDTAKRRNLETGSIGNFLNMDIYSFQGQVRVDGALEDLIPNQMITFQRGSELGETFVSKNYTINREQAARGGKPIYIEAEKEFKCKVMRKFIVDRVDDLY